jgi:thiol:disulfide interchange protein DsbA
MPSAQIFEELRMKIVDAILAVVVGACAAGVSADTFEVGVHYDLLPISVATADPSKIEVVEVFSYGCPHCFNFDPAIEAWKAKQPSDVSFRRLPAVFRKEWEILAQAYYTAEVLGVTDKVHRPIFEAIHLKGLNGGDPDVLASVFQQSAQVTPEAFLKVLNSFAVRSKVQQADAQGRMYRLTGVPTLIVDGKYTVYGQNLVGSNSDRLAVVDYLVAKERAARTPVKEVHAP